MVIILLYVMDRCSVAVGKSIHLAIGRLGVRIQAATELSRKQVVTTPNAWQ